MGLYKRGNDNEAIITGIALVVAWIIVSFLLQARKRLARSLSPKQMEDFVVGSVLIYGSMKLFTLVYLTAQGYKCLGGGANYCTATTLPVLSISFMIFIVLIYRLAILPLTTAPITRSQVGSLNISLKNRASMLGILFAGLGNTFLFSSIEDGSIEDPMWYLTYVVIAAIVFVMFVELIAIIYYQRERRRQMIATESFSAQPPPSTSPDRGTDDREKIMDKIASGMT